MRKSSSIVPVMTIKLTRVQETDSKPMNWRLQNQILIPMLVVTALGISLATYINIRGLIRNENERIDSQIESLFETLAATSFPLTTGSVLRQVEQISGIHLVVQQDNDTVSSFAADEATTLFQRLNSRDKSRDSFLIQDKEYKVYQQSIPARKLEIIALYPRDQFFAAIRKVVYPQVVSGSLTLAVVIALVVLVARNVTLPIRSLEKHVHRIAEGDFSEQPPVRENSRQDEIGQLFRSINEMAEKLQLYEKRIRAQEKLLTLDQMGGGIAHQMRNSITGCRLALDLHRQNCEGDQESLDVAIRQLTFMEDFQKRFLSFSKDNNRTKQKLDLVSVVHQYTKLLEPLARHVHVDFQVQVPDEPIWIWGNEHMVQQLVGNLVTNAIEAASTHSSASEKSVFVEVAKVEGKPALTVRDSGAGIAEDVSERLFEPLVTTKPDGVGLGLAIVKQTVDEHNAKIVWYQQDANTYFVVVFPPDTDSRTDESAK